MSDSFETTCLRGLSKAEKNLFAFLNEFVEQECPGTVLRVAGGWVRDHLLGLQSNDIDITVSNMSGEALARKLAAYMDKTGFAHRGITVVKSNPEQSKHLATAMLNVFGFDIDFANLRKETYADSRIPTTEPGTPKEDAQRRDLTINSLFYNIHTQNVEDYIGGLRDLEQKIARTPIDPVKTFMDDPLRILRIIRFATRFSLSVSDDIYQAAIKPEVQSALDTKVSRERVWKEMAGQDDGHGGWKRGFFSGPEVHKAYIHLRRMNLDGFFLFERDPIELFTMTWNGIPETNKDCLVRTLAVLFWKKDEKFLRFVEKFGIPNEISKRVSTILLWTSLFDEKNSDVNLRKGLVGLKDDWRLCWQITSSQHTLPTDFYTRVNKQIAEMNGLKIRLPITGNDVMFCGVVAGAPVGLCMSMLTDQWFKNPKMTGVEATKLVKQWLHDNPHYDSCVD